MGAQTRSLVAGIALAAMVASGLAAGGYWTGPSLAAGGNWAATSSVAAADRVLTSQDMSDLVAVANDVSPDLARMLQVAMEQNPEAFALALQKSGKRLQSLLTLKRLRPSLYEVRVMEMRLESEAADLGQQLRSAAASDQPEDTAAIEENLRAVGQKLIDQNLRARGLELAELDQAVKSMRLELERDAKSRLATLDSMVDAYRAGGTVPALGGRSPVASMAAGSR